MGVVQKEVTTSFISRGYPYHTATLFVYCDACGSCSIKPYIDFRKWLLIIFFSASIGAIVLTASSGAGLELSHLCLGLVVSVTTAIFLGGKRGYKCRKCGNATTTRYNTRGMPYGGGDRVDVPEEMTQKISLGYWPDQCDLSEYLEPPADFKRTDSEV